jgi:hypothetical protein
MLATQLALRDRIAALTFPDGIAVQVIEEDQVRADPALPAIVLTYEGKKRYKKTRAFFLERWAVWILAPLGDLFTIETIADALLDSLDGATLDNPAVGSTAGLDVNHLMDGPAGADDVLKFQTQVVYYEVLTQKIATP